MARIRRARGADVGAVADLLREAYRPEAERDQDPGVLDRVASPERVRQFIRDNETYVLEEGGRIVATGTLQSVVYVRRVATLASERGQGHGRTMVDHLLRRARARGHRRAVLFADAKLPWLRRWYEGWGFQATARMEMVDSRFTAFYMEKALDQGTAKKARRDPKTKT